MKKEDFKIGMNVVSVESELYPFPLEGYSGVVTRIAEEDNFDGTCIEVNGEHGFWFTVDELKIV